MRINYDFCNLLVKQIPPFEVIEFEDDILMEATANDLISQAEILFTSDISQKSPPVARVCNVLLLDRVSAHVQESGLLSNRT